MIRLGGLFFVLALVSCSGVTPRAVDYQPPPIAAEAVREAVPMPAPVSAMGNKSPYSVFGQTYTVMPSAKGYVEEGIASWYGMKFQGRLTSNGEIFDVYQATAAHKALPLPSFVRITNLETNLSMVVRVNDRGPFVADRLIDVSYGVAVRLGFAEQGTARVRVEYIDVEGTDDWRASGDGGYRRLQIGAYETEAAAAQVSRRLRAVVGLPIPIDVSEVLSGERTIYRVRVGPVENPGQLGELQDRLADEGLPRGQRLP